MTTDKSIDETKLTAYALGELDDNEAAEVEAHLNDNPDTRRTVDEIRSVGSLVRDELAREPALKLTDEQRQAVQRGRGPRKRFGVLTRITAVAAVLVAIFCVASFFWPTLGGTAMRMQASKRRSLSQEPDFAGGRPTTADGIAPPSPPAGGELTGFMLRPIRVQPLASGVREDMHKSLRLDAYIAPREDDTLIESTESIRPRSDDWNREAYEHVVDNPFMAVADNPLSTFSIDVDTASYSNMRRILNAGRLPPAGAVRIEELVNYFDYAYTPPAAEDEHPFVAHMDVTRCPWQPDHKLARIAIKGYEIIDEQRPPGNFVFLLDVSGSMNNPNKLPLVRSAMKLLVGRLGAEDRIAIVVYAGAAGLVLESVACNEKAQIVAAIDSLTPGGSTAGAAGIRLAYKVAQANFIEGGVNRVILCTDGDFNVGTTSESELVDLIEDKATSGVFITVLGFGMGNYQDSRLEKLADKGNGNYGYIDTLAEARKMLVEQMSGTLITIAKDVKIQIEFNPAKVAGYRLIGYENRILAKEDFNDDTKDAGEIGAGHTVTALYEIVPAGVPVPTTGSVDPLKYQHPDSVEARKARPHSDELLTLKLRYKQPDGDTSTLMQMPVADRDVSFDEASDDFRFAAAVASFGMILRDSPYKGNATLAGVIESAQSAKGEDPNGYRAEFIQLAKLARDLMAGEND